MKEFSGAVALKGAAARLQDSLRSTALAAMTGALAVPLFIGSASPAAAAERSLKLFFTHTGERATITFKRDGRFDPQGLAQINRFLRDWRKNEPARMDPRLLDLVWEAYDRSGAKDYIHVVSAYRSPATNNMLRGRSRSTGVAKNSQHMLGKAMDFYIPGVKLATLRAIAMQAQVGGVGYYPTSGSPFVHLDVGNVRAWPRMSRQELARIFPNGKTMHLPANGSPLPGYEQAVADYKRRVGATSIEIASTAGDDDDDTGLSVKKSSLLTAMLPTPRSRAEEALEMQTTAAVTAQPQSGAEFADLASLAVPIPTVRPTKIVSADEIKTASIAPISGMSGIWNRAFVTPQVSLKQPAASIASLPLDRTETDPEEEFDARESFVTWALSAPGSSVGMTAPSFVRRALTSPGLEKAVVTDFVPGAVAEEFDNGRFWSDG